MTTPTKLSSAGFDVARLAPATIAALAASLSPEERHVILAHGTERPFCGTLLDNKKHGTYVCRLCALPLFSSKAKFESGTGWPSFFQPYAAEHVETITDESYGMVRVEIRCQRCGGHLGHVFPDGPAPTRQRYCLNSASLEFVDEGAALPQRVDSDRGPARTG
jgi:peptide-methionine (R)-S-oxide reductase